MTGTARYATIVCAAAAVAGCAGAPDGEVSEAVSSDPCEQEWRCGGNSPVVDAHGFHELSLLEVPNEAGMMVHGSAGQAVINVRGRPYQLAIEDSQIVARNGPLTLTGRALLGAIIPLDGPHGASYELRIEAARLMPFPFPLGSVEPVAAYVLGWRSVTAAPTAFVNLCAHPPVDLLTLSAEQAFPELLGLAPTEAVVFAGDRIDGAAKTMSATPDPGWFNIGCAGHTIAKLHLTRNTIASQHAADPRVLRDRRQATFKLLVADYCGTGRAFTVPGKPLQWKGDAGEPRDAFFAGVPLAGIEARWTASGASCLSTPRLATMAEIAAECEPPPQCAPAGPDQLAGALRVSVDVASPPP